MVGNRKSTPRWVSILICTLPSAASCICATEPVRMAYLTGLRMVSVSPILRLAELGFVGAVDHFRGDKIVVELHQAFLGDDAGG